MFGAARAWYAVKRRWRQGITITLGGDYRSGRSEKWRFLLIDDEGRRVADSNFFSFDDSGGLFSSQTLEHRKKSDHQFRFDLRNYLAPPRSGKYRLQAIHHQHEHIAGEPNLAGLIVTKSEPLTVFVNASETSNSTQVVAALPQVLAAVAACAMLLTFVLTGKAQRHAGPAAATRKDPSRRIVFDIVWCALVLAIALAWGLDQRHQAFLRTSLRPDAEANWSISFPSNDSS
jgi:hypothetical protein